MSATAFQLRRRQEAAALIIEQLKTTRNRRRFADAAPIHCAEPSAEAVYAGIASYTDPSELLALAADIARPKRRRSG